MKEKKKKLISILESLKDNLNKRNDESIIEVYSKYAKNSNDFLRKEIKQECSRLCVEDIFFGFLFLFYCFNVISIFISKNILDNLWIVIENSLLNIFAPKIEDSDSLYNYYSIFFKNAVTPSFNFDLMMIMNFLGDIILQSCGFRKTSILFFIINLISFTFIFIFNFIKYNEVGKYNLSQIICLILIYALLFIGVGSSSLLSQKVLVEFNQRTIEYIEQKDNELIRKVYEMNEDDERISKKDNVDGNNKNIRSFLLITMGTLVSYYTFWYNNYISSIIQILEENKINNIYENITNNIDINLNTSRTNAIYNRNKEIFIFYQLINYIDFFIFSFFCFFLLLVFLKKRKILIKRKMTYYFISIIKKIYSIYIFIYFRS